MAWGCLEFFGDGRQQKRNQLSVRYSKEEYAKKDERDLPLKRVAVGTVGHARILTHTILEAWGMEACEDLLTQNLPDELYPDYSLQL